MKDFFKKNLRWLYILLPALAVLLEALPFGATLYFATPEREPIVRTYSYFSLMPFGYANFAPLLTAICSCLLLAAGIFTVWQGKGKKVYCILAFVAAGLSVCPIFLGARYYTLLAGCITATLIAAAFAGYFLMKIDK